MSKINRHPVRRTAAGVLAGALALSGAVAAATPAFAGPGFALERVAGENRYETSAAIAAQFGATSGAILASGETGRSVDALSANFLAGVQGVPVLLTQRDRIPASVLARLNALTGAKNVTIVGGTVAVSAAVETQLRTAGFTVTRLGGADRYATSEAIITAGRASANPIGLVASGTSFPDALAGGPLSYKGKHPVFLTNGGGLPQDTIDAMVAAGTRSVIILGGTAAVPASVEAALAARNITVVTRLGGAGRSETSRIIADYLINSAGFTNTTFNVASGVPRGEGVDALSGAALSGKENRALLITDTATAAGPVVAFATARANTLNAVGDIFGGPAAVSAAVETQIETAGAASVSNQTFATTLTGTATVELGGDAASRTRTFSVAVPAGTAVDIQLFAAANVQTAANGTVTFTDANGDNAADPGTVAGTSVTTVNGAPFTANGSFTSSGTVTFTVTGTTTNEAVVPVIFVDANNDNRLNLTPPATGTNLNPKTPSEQFSVGPVLTFVPQAAALGSSSPSVTSANVDQDFFIGNVTAGGVTTAFTYRFDANDVFQFQGVAITLAQFESLISSGDALTIAFSPAATGVSTFNIISNAGGAAPDAPTAAPANADAGTVINDVRITYTRPENNSAGVTYTLQRAAVTAGPDAIPGNADDLGTFATVTTATQAAGTGTRVFVFTDLNLPNGTYRYRVVATTPVTGDVQNSDPSNPVTIPGTVENDRPQALDTVLTVNGAGGFAGSLDEGDTFVVRFDEVVTVAAGARLRVRDDEATDSVADLVNGGNATFTLNTAAQTVNTVSGAIGTVLTVRINTAPTVVTAGTTGGIQLPATIVDSAGIADVNGTAFAPSIVGSQDLVIEAVGSDTTSGAPAPAPTSTTVSAAALPTNVNNAALVDVGDVFTVTFSGPVTGAVTGQFELTDAGGSVGTFVCAAPGCTYDAATNTLSADVGGLPTISGDGDFDLPGLTITAITGVSGTASAPFALGTGDRTIG